MDFTTSKHLCVDNFALARINMDPDMLTSNSDLSYRIINDVVIIGKNIIQSKLDGCIIKNSKIIESDFRRCDINVARIENCTFVKVDFSSSDIISSIFSNCEFIECSFEETHISDCEFVNSRFNKTNLSNCSFLNSCVKNSNFFASDFSSSTIILNKYYYTSFNNMSLGNTTFEYHIMRKCEFNNVVINTDSLAYMYGCEEKQLRSVKLIFLGKEIAGEYSFDFNFFNELLKGLIIKRWYLGALLLRMNYKFASIYECLNMILELFLKQDHLGFLLKRDELRYVINIIHEQHSTGELSSLILDTFIKRISSVNSITTKNKQVLDELCIEASKLKDIQDKEILAACKNIENNITSERITAELIFKEKPTIDPEVLFSYINQQCNSNIKIVSERKGSYILVIIGTLYAITQILRLFKYLTGNSLEIYKNSVILKELIVNAELRRKYKKRVLSKTLNTNDKENINQHLSIVINQISSNIDTSMFKDIIRSPNYGGYDRNNLSKINIINNNSAL